MTRAEVMTGDGRVAASCILLQTRHTGGRHRGTDAD